MPAELPDGRLVTAADRDGARRLLADGEALTPADLQVRSVVACRAGTITFLANPIDDPTVQHVWRWTIGAGPGESGQLAALTTEPGMHTASTGGAVVVVRRSSVGAPNATTFVLGGPTIAGFAEVPLVTPNVRILRLGDRRLAVAVLLPHGAGEDDRLPVLLDPYGGPHAQRVISSNAAYLDVAVVRRPGLRRGDRRRPRHPRPRQRLGALRAPRPRRARPRRPGRGAARWPRPRCPSSTSSGSAIRGWSFGGYLAALAVLRRPDVFHAAVAGAPVTEWRLYDTHYTERYLGDPDIDPEPYDRTSLLLEADKLERPLLLVHGLADDNVVAAHTLQLSSALLAGGRHHEVLPLSGVSHMTPQAVVAENLLLHQLAFLRKELNLHG